MSADGTGKFGGCCEVLKDVLESEEFEPLIAADDDGILYMSIGMVDPEKDDDPRHFSALPSRLFCHRVTSCRTR